MTPRPYVLLSVAVSLDGYIDDGSATRLMLSNEQDVERMHRVRAGVDAILVGANTVRTDDPRLTVRFGVPADPVKVTITAGGRLDPSARFFTTGDAGKLVYTPTSVAPAVRDRLGGVATVIGAGDPLDPRRVLADLAARNVERLMVEGGGAIHTMFLTEGLADELQLVCAPFFVGDPEAPRFVRPGTFPQDAEHPLTLAEVRRLGDVVLLRYLSPGGKEDEA
ncbi:RibD family protein [Amycolatopsis cihanbeyliensis]|uniref:5-amino-6-(5-phosphoribosylamino)uracil reductase n=1 Tax=Amycolatopsis cihanbeyliensis TaxID=1128664 RepID=A0A542CS95_AMYCI|nr:RibD family protein [Amycolatopsis cihanbeyliensis]TQI93686.1 5-amino-6-(5-phosphoribosylamino)uracil reductase [Amycolatopsis cihanbeyliensis]